MNFFSIRKTVLVLVTAVVLGTGYSSTASAAPGCHIGDGQGYGIFGFGAEGRVYGIILRRLNLTSDQVSQIRAIRNQYRGEFNLLHRSQKASRAALRTLVGADPYDEEAVAAKATELGDVIAKEMKLRMDRLAAVYAVLNDTQVALLQNYEIAKARRCRADLR